MNIGIGTQQCRVSNMCVWVKQVCWPKEKGCNELWSFYVTPPLASSPALSLVGNPKRELDPEVHVTNTLQELA